MIAGAVLVLLVVVGGIFLLIGATQTDGDTDGTLGSTASSTVVLRT